MLNLKIQTKQVNRLAPKIAVIGVGGAGGNAVNNMISSNLEGCEFIVCNADAQALEHSLAEVKIQLGVGVTGGLGAGAKPQIGKAAAEESIEEVLGYLDGANMAFVTAGMGGGTGTGAAPVIAKACRERGILTVGVVTKPFHFEGTHRMRMAEEGIREMQEYFYTLIVIPNQNLFRVANEKISFAEAFRMVDGVLQSGVRGVTDLMMRPGLINLDFADIRTAMMEMGKAMMGTGEATGEKRAIEAAEAAINNPLLDDVSMKGARGVIINVTGGNDMSLFEVDEACNRIRDEVDSDANIIFGATFDESMQGSMRVSIVATGIDKDSVVRRRPLTEGGTTDARGKAPVQTKTDTAPSQVAAPQNSPAPRQPTPVYAAPSSRAFTPPPAPPSAMTAPTPRVPQTTTPVPEPEEEVFERAEFKSPETPPAESVNTAMRGTRYRDTFIPPRPVEAVAAADQGAPRASAGFHGENLQGTQASSVATTSPLNLNAPRAPEEAKKRSPSLFERIAGAARSQIDNFREEPQTSHTRAERVAPHVPGGSPGSSPVPTRPAQGTLNIDLPAARPRAQVSEESELDIPAFLRRQAN